MLVMACNSPVCQDYIANVSLEAKLHASYSKKSFLQWVTLCMIMQIARLHVPYADVTCHGGECERCRRIMCHNLNHMGSSMQSRQEWYCACKSNMKQLWQRHTYTALSYMSRLSTSFQLQQSFSEASAVLVTAAWEQHMHAVSLVHCMQALPCVWST